MTEQHGRLDTLLVERSRSRFLASASGRLGLSLHPGRTARTVVELAVAGLAQAVAVVWPLVVAAMERLRGRPEPAARLTDSALDDDLGQVVEFLAAAIYFVDRGLFAGHVGWLAEVAAARGASGTALPDVLDAFRAELHDFPFAAVCLDAGHEVLRRPAMNGAVHSRGEGPR